MKNTYTIISYNNYELKLMVFLINGHKPFLIFEEFIEKVNINGFTSDLEKDRLAGQISEAFEKSLKVSKNDKKEVYLVFDADNFFYDTKTLNFDFSEQHVINKQDIQKVYQHSMASEKVREGFIPIHFQVNKFLLDDNRLVPNPIGSTASKLAANGELVFSDSPTFYNIKDIIETYGITIADSIVGGYVLNKAAHLDVNHGLMEISTERINFAVNLEQDYKQFSIEMGFRKILESVYEQLCENHKPTDSERAVRFLMEYFTLKPYECDRVVVGDIMLNELIEMFSHIIIDYFNYIFEQLVKQNINCEMFSVILHDYVPCEFIELLNEHINIKFIEYKNSEYSNVKPANLKGYLATVEFDKMNIQVER